MALQLNYPEDIQFAGLVEAANAAADAQRGDLGKRRRDEENAYVGAAIGANLFGEPSQNIPLLTNSAAVLFREPSEKSKKYSRPPLGKVFNSLELIPEAFLRLQSAAKTFMLDPEHPERKDVVGQKKHSSNNDIAKLRLWQSVEEFLLLNDHGQKLFGHSAVVLPDQPLRSFYWPEDGNRIIKLLMPLFRKMVTNERQRVYAAETRRGGEATKADASSVEAPKQIPRQAAVLRAIPALDEQYHITTSIDPQLQTDSDLKQLATTATQQTASAQSLPQSDGPVSLRISIVSTEGNVQRRLMPEISIASTEVTSFDSLCTYLRGRCSMLSKSFTVRVWLPSGLTNVDDEGGWIISQLSAGMYEWMDGQLKVIVEV